jgi:hypothetical protein
MQSTQLTDALSSAMEGVRGGGVELMGLTQCERRAEPGTARE